MTVRFGATVGADIVARDAEGNLIGERHAPKNLYADFDIKTKAVVEVKQ